MLYYLRLNFYHHHFLYVVCTKIPSNIMNGTIYQALFALQSMTSLYLQFSAPALTSKQITKYYWL